MTISQIWLSKTKNGSSLSPVFHSTVVVLILTTHTEYPTKEECDKTQEFIDGALRMMRTMEINVTVKGHGGEIHIVPQMRSIKGGLFEFDESWTELYHQIGHAFDMRLRNQSSEKRKALVRAAEERRVSKSETQAALERLIVLERGKRKSTIVKETKVKRVKKEARENALKKIE